MYNTYIVRLYYTCDSFRGASEVRYSRCRDRARVDVGLNVGISVTEDIKSANSIDDFKRKVKTCLFMRAYES